MRQVLSVSKKRTIPSWKQWRQLPRVLTQKEGRLLGGAIAVFFLSAITLGVWELAIHRSNNPAVGGEYTEALIGEPQYINPLYASSSDVDSDLTKLVYSGLMRWDPTQGLVNDLASNVQISEDGKTYTITLRDDAKFHNGDAVLARDVVFTIEAIQNDQYRSPLAVSFSGVAVSQVDDRTVAFQLNEPFAPFLSTLTVGILPEDVWTDVSPRNAPLASRNLEPVGSGPYRFSKFSKDKNGNILSYTLERNADYYGEKPLIQTLTFKFYADSEGSVQALSNRNVEGVSFVPTDQETEVAKNHSVVILHPTIPRETVLFFNQEKNAALKDANVRKALALAIDKQAIVDQALGGYGTVIDAPILPGMLGYSPDVAKLTEDTATANNLLDTAGHPWAEGAPFRSLTKNGTTSGDGSTENELSFTLTTVQSPEFIKAAQMLVDQMVPIGVRITVETVAPDEFYDKVIAPRNYELLLTGELLGIDPDPYPFWHSSQAKVGGLNLAGYANRKADALLEDARKLTNADERAAKYKEFQDILAADIPAVFLYQSTYAYAVASKIKNVQIDRIATPADRFANVVEWYIKTKKTLQ